MDLIHFGFPLPFLTALRQILILTIPEMDMVPKAVPWVFQFMPILSLRLSFFLYYLLFQAQNSASLPGYLFSNSWLVSDTSSLDQTSATISLI